MDDTNMMDVSGSAPPSIPRLNGRLLKSRQWHGEVSIVGKFLGSNGNDSASLPFEASDGQKFVVKRDLEQPWDGYSAKFIEIRGVVQNDGSVLQQSYQEWGNEFIMETWDKFVTLSHQYPGVF